MELVNISWVSKEGRCLGRDSIQYCDWKNMGRMANQKEKNSGNASGDQKQRNSCNSGSDLIGSNQREDFSSDIVGGNLFQLFALVSYHSFPSWEREYNKLLA